MSGSAFSGFFSTRMARIITVFGSSRPEQGSSGYQQAYEVGLALGTAGFTVCNGGYGGTMEATARGAKDGRSTTVGVTSEFFGRKANRWIDKEITTHTPVERLLKLIELGDGYLILKGGTGTLLELAAVWEFVNKGMVKEKPIVVLGDFWKPLLTLMKDELVWEGLEECSKFISQAMTTEECVREFRSRLERA